MTNLFETRDATLSKDRRYRYALWRRWGDGPYLLFIGLNPSTADEYEDDPTIRRCRRFAMDWGFDALCMANLFAWRATAPTDMKAAKDPVGRDNDAWLRKLAAGAGRTVAAWGVHGGHQGRDQAVMRLVPGLHHLGLTKAGHPRHPLYLPASTLPQPWAAQDR